MSSDEETQTKYTPRTPQEWRKWKEEGKQKKRKWKEEKLISKLEKKQKLDRETECLKQEEKEDEQRSQSQGRHHTVSIALPGSILDNAQSPELRTYLAGQIARAAVIFNIDEIVIFDETGSKSRTTEGEFDGVGKKGNCNVQMARILQYLECPQYLRKSFFPKHADLNFAGLLNPLDTPHHMKVDDDVPYREGVVLDKPVKPGKGSFVNVGLYKEIQIDRQLRPGLRVTVKMLPSEGGKKVLGKVVSPDHPRTHGGFYWGYSVRLADTLSSVFTECPHKGGYDLLIGTSERGQNVDAFDMPKFKHMLVVFGGVQGLETSVDTDQALKIDDPGLLFQHYLNTCPSQGSHTIRTEEAILISMSALRQKIEATHPRTSTS